MIDREGIAVGVLLSLFAQGFYDILFYAVSGRIAEEWTAFIAMGAAFIFLILTFFRAGYFKERKHRRQKKQDQGSESGQEISQEPQNRKWKKWIKKTENKALVLSIVALFVTTGFTALNTYHEWNPPAPPAPRARFTVFADTPILWHNPDNVTEIDLTGSIVNEGSLAGHIVRWDLFIDVNVSYSILSEKYELPTDRLLSPTESGNFTMQKTLIGENHTRLSDTAIRNCTAWFEYTDASGVQTAES